MPIYNELYLVTMLEKYHFCTSILLNLYKVFQMRGHNKENLAIHLILKEYLFSTSDGYINQLVT